MNRTLLDALQGKNRGPVPIWLMRQAGRYMPEYQAMRAKYSFLELCHYPELIAEVTLLPLQSFDLDAAILFSDILLIPEALGMGLHFEDKVGPILERPLELPGDIYSLPNIDIREALHYVSQGISLLKDQLKVPLIGFCGAPFTLASYMIEGGSGSDLYKTKHWMLSDPSSFHHLLEKLMQYAFTYLEMQVEAGVQVLQIFDTWAGVLGYTQFREFSLYYLDQIVKHFKDKVPVILFCRGSSVFAHEMAKVQPAGISVDWNAHLASLRQKISPQIALQGNLDPEILCAPLSVMRKETLRLLSSMNGDPAYIFNLGHGISQRTPVDTVKALVACVKEG